MSWTRSKSNLDHKEDCLSPQHYCIHVHVSVASRNEECCMDVYVCGVTYIQMLILLPDIILNISCYFKLALFLFVFITLSLRCLPNITLNGCSYGMRQLVKGFLSSLSIVKGLGLLTSLVLILRN